MGQHVLYSGSFSQKVKIIKRSSLAPDQEEEVEWECDGSEQGVGGGDMEVGGCRKRPHSVLEKLLFNESQS